MIIRTISQLPETKSPAYTSVFEISVEKEPGKYISKKISLDSLRKIIEDPIRDTIIDNFSLTDDNKNNINISELKTNINNIINDEITFSGKKVFNEEIEYNSNFVDQSYNSADNNSSLLTLASKKYVLDAIKNKNTFDITNNNINDTGFITIDKEVSPNVDDSAAHTLKLYFPENNNTSNNEYDYVDVYGRQHSTQFATTKSGQLVMYGWLADTGNVETAAAWVALEGKINNKWIILQVQPWILGEKHSYLQYVGFNIDVPNGILLRVSTGFRLNYSNSTYQDNHNSLVIDIGGNGTVSPNEFVGFIL